MHENLWFVLKTNDIYDSLHELIDFFYIEKYRQLFGLVDKYKKYIDGGGLVFLFFFLVIENHMFVWHSKHFAHLMCNGWCIRKIANYRMHIMMMGASIGIQKHEYVRLSHTKISPDSELITLWCAYDALTGCM